jgi:hypothetical protein
MKLVADLMPRTAGKFAGFDIRLWLIELKYAPPKERCSSFVQYSKVCQAWGCQPRSLMYVFTK